MRGLVRWIVAVGAAVLAALTIVAWALAHNVGGFEIDADHVTASHALYSGNDGGDDWADGGPNNGIFAPSPSAPHTAAADCYGSNIDKVSQDLPSTLICDGNSDPTFRTTEPEQTIVSPSGKTPDDQWPIKPGNVRAKNDFSHAYVHASLVDSPCDTDTLPNNVVLHLAGHVGDNEGDHFWGFEFNRTAPGGFDTLKANNGTSFTLDFNRTVGDLMVSFTVPGNTSNPVQLELFRVSGFASNGSAIFTPAGTQPGCPSGQPQGLSLLTTNNFNDVEAPPWNVPVCDPTGDNGSNSCRLANGLTDAEDLLAPRDFAEASVDLTAFGIEPCFTNVIFSSRSAHPLEGADIQDVGGGDFPLCGEKSGTKFHDHNANGVRDAGDEAISGWPISLYADANGDKVLQDADDGAADGQFTTARPVQNTDGNGAYSFKNLANGNYIVCEAADPGNAGWHESLPNAGTAGNADCSAVSGLAAKGYGFLMDATTHAGNDFGNYKNASKSGTKFDDLNGNGAKDAGEPGIAGVGIHLSGTDNVGGSVHRHTTTGADGTYSFADIRPGTYQVCETVPTGYTQSYPTGTTPSSTACSAPHTGRGWAITLSSGESDTGNDFGNFANGTKSGTKFDDLDADGVRDAGEPGIAGVEIHLVGTDGLGNAVHLHATTASDGTYSINAPPGHYTACETVPAGYTQSYPTAATPGSVACVAPHSGRGWDVTLTSGSTDSGNDFGNFRNATKSGTKFDDLNADGDRDGGEPGVGGVRIHLFGTDGAGNAVHLHATTDSDGNYSLSVPPGSYTVCETVPAGYIQSFPTSGPSCAGHEDASGVGYSITLTSGQTDSGNDFGNFRNATKSGTKFDDLNADGDRDAGEPGVSGVRIHLFGTDGAGNLVHEHATTDVNGDYSISVRPGSYTVCETVPAGYIQSFPTSGPSCAGHEDASGFGYSITLTSGQTDSGNDFGNFRNATKSGTKFEDVNGDGDRDLGEPGLADVQIHLFGTDGAGNLVHLHTTTDSIGGYSFSVRPGSYTVCESVPAGYTQSFPASGADCSGHPGAGGIGYAITLTSGEVDSGNDFGNFRNATKSGTKFDDLNANGARDLLEPGVAGVLIHLFGIDGRGNAVHVDTTTDGAGAYSFSVPPGTYTVCETVPAGYTQSFPASGPDCAGHDTASGVGYSITLTSGETDAGNDFGNFRQATISGVKFKDADAGGDRDPDEIGLAGWEIHLFGTAGTGASIHLHAVTDAQGAFSFTVPPGSYTVCETISGKPGWVQTFPVAAADCTGHTHSGTITPGANGHAVTVISGQATGGIDFGNAPLSRVVVTFEPLADLPGGGDATRATSISCTDSGNQGVGAVTDQNTLTTDNVRTNQSSLQCVVTYTDP